MKTRLLTHDFPVHGKMLPWELFSSVIFGGFRAFKTSGNKGVLQEITYEICNSSKVIVSESFFENNVVLQNYRGP